MVSAPKLGETLRVGKAMKKGFTLIEMMIVVAILVVLMTITFRLSKLGSNADRRTRTVTRMQKLENCLSGYHAAFGSYPPVKLHGSRDIYNQVDRHGIQNDERNENLWNWNKIGEQAEWNAWNQVNAACKSQPVDCRFPYPEGYSKKIDIMDSGMILQYGAARSWRQASTTAFRATRTVTRSTRAKSTGVTCSCSSSV